MTTVEVPSVRLEGWLRRFTARNGEVASIDYDAGTATITTIRGGTAAIAGAWDRCAVTDPGPAANLDALISACVPPTRVAVVLVRRGGYCLGVAVHNGSGYDVLASKTGGTYVQGRTAAGGQSQQRFARRRANQALSLIKAAEVAAGRVFAAATQPDLLITGGDRLMLEDLLGRSALGWSHAVTRIAHVPVPTPRRRVLDAAIAVATSLRIVVDNAPGGDSTP